MAEYIERFEHDPQSVGDEVDKKYRPGRVSVMEKLRLMLV
jgi:hypothetical protein